jgi:hypothetical protein
MAQIDHLRKRITKDQYLQYKDSQISDKSIVASLGLGTESWVTVLKRLKKEWGVVGVTNKSSLCYSCRNAVPQLCRWIRSGDLAGRRYKTVTVDHQLADIITVTYCPNYQTGELPPLGRVSA